MEWCGVQRIGDAQARLGVNLFPGGAPRVAATKRRGDRQPEMGKTQRPVYRLPSTVCGPPSHSSPSHPPRPSLIARGDVRPLLSGMQTPAGGAESLHDQVSPLARFPLPVLLFALSTVQSTLFFLYRYLDDRVYVDDVSPIPPLIDEFTGGYGGMALFYLFILPFARRHRLTRRGWAQQVPSYVLLLIAFSIVHTSLNWGLRSLIYPLAGVGSYDYGRMPLRYLMEFPIDTISFALAIVIVNLWWAYRDGRDRQLHAEQLERALTESRLRVLRLQLQPHFLFNALNTIASRMYDDVAAADAMLTHLASLLRASLRTTEAQMVSLESELSTLGHYVALLEGRFGDRCTIGISIPEELRSALVPSLVLQPLVENAVRHGNLSLTGRGVIHVSACREGDDLVLGVEDDGPGATRDPWQGDGLGLRATADRLRLIYGEHHSIQARNGDRGFRASIRFPYAVAVTAHA
jgi:two-component system, LytTR family, sensor kinase